MHCSMITYNNRCKKNIIKYIFTIHHETQPLPSIPQPPPTTSCQVSSTKQLYTLGARELCVAVNILNGTRSLHVWWSFRLSYSTKTRPLRIQTSGGCEWGQWDGFAHISTSTTTALIHTEYSYIPNTVVVEQLFGSSRMQMHRDENFFMPKATAAAKLGYWCRLLPVSTTTITTSNLFASGPPRRTIFLDGLQSLGRWVCTFPVLQTTYIYRAQHI